jgi:hypothetical protein
LVCAAAKTRGAQPKPIRVLPFLNERRASLSQIIIFDFRTFLLNEIMGTAKILDKRAQVRFIYNQK